LYGVTVFFLFVILNVVEHFTQGIQFIGARFGVKQKCLVVPGVDGNQIKFDFPVKGRILKHEVRGSQAQIIFNFLLYTGCFYVHFTAGFNHGYNFKGETFIGFEKFPIFMQS